MWCQRTAGRSDSIRPFTASPLRVIMPDIQAFRGIRYDLGHVGSLSSVIAPPYDVIDPTLQDQLYKLHPANVVRLILNREEPGDDEATNRYSRAAKFFKNWQSEGVLFTEPDPALYVYHQEFSYGGQAYTRRGSWRVRLSDLARERSTPTKRRWPVRSKIACC